TPPGDDDEDYVPSFPAIGSAQRAAPSMASLRPQSNAASMMLPPPLPNRFQGQPNSRKPVRNMAANGLMDSLRSQRSGGLQTPPTITEKPKKPRKKVILEPGHSPLDWARLQRSGYDLRGISTPGFLRITPSELKKHNNQPDDVWTALNGKVYNLSAYLPFHPGGEREALRGAGKDCTTLFMKVHPWVNAEGMLKECLIGFLVPEDDESASIDIQTDDKPVVINGSLEDID
ncbi:cytochrome b5, partial [Ascobolus immersus RN42]